MASTASTLLAALLGLLLWTGTGWAIARRLPIDRALMLPAAPALGWAAQNAAALALSLAAGLSLWTMLGAAVLLIAAASWLGRPAQGEGPRAPPWLYVAAALLAAVPAAAVLPKVTAEGVLLAAPIYDHAKIALVAEIARAGVPPVNPVYGAEGAPSGVAYYYLWHFGAAQLARLAGVSAWDGDVAATWFTAFAALCLMGGLALRIGGNRAAPLLAVAACAAGSLRPVLYWLAGGDAALDRWLHFSSGFAGWLFQTSWSPHHMAAACCTLLAALLLAGLGTQATAFGALVLALVVAAGFGASIWVGGVVFAIAGPLIAAALLWRAAPGRRLPFLAAGIAAALGAAALSAPLLLEQLAAAASRGGGAPVIVEALPVLGPMLPDPPRRLLDLAAYWLLLLPIEFPVAVLAGTAGLWHWARPRRGRTVPLPALALVLLAAVSFCGAWLLVSTAGENNDLGWRAVLPGLLIATAAGAAAVARWLAEGPRLAAMALILVFALALPDGIDIAAGNLFGERKPSSAAFAEAPAAWAALRRHVAPDARVVNNPRALVDLTPWPINLGWALLSDRRSCFAGPEMALAFAPLPAGRRDAISDFVERIFAGEGSAEDVATLAGPLRCRAALLTPADGAWSRDPFATSPHWRLAEEAPGWRIYVSTAPPSAHR
jgi:hypothetical protein